MRHGLGALGLAVALATASTATGACAADGNAGHGEVLARRWCAGCHLVAPDQTKASADAPSFAALAADPPRSLESLADFLLLPGTTHSKMPDLALSRVDIADIVAHIRSLRK